MTLTGFMALIIVLPLTIGIFGGEWLFKTKEKIKMKRFTTKVLKSAGVLMLLASAAFGQIGFTSSGGGVPYKQYVAQLYQSGDGTSTQTSGELTIGALYKITDYVGGVTATINLTDGGTGYTTASPVNTTGGTGTGLTVSVTAVDGIVTVVEIVDAGEGYTVDDVITIDDGNTDAAFTITAVNSDDFTNVGASSNELDVEFYATGTTPTVWTEGSELTDLAAPIPNILVNTLTNARWVRTGVGGYRLLFDDTENKCSYYLMAMGGDGGTTATRETRYGEALILTYNSTPELADGIMQLYATWFELRIYPNIPEHPLGCSD